MYIVLALNIMTLIAIKYYIIYLTVSLSNSMYPKIKKGDILLVKGKVRAEKLKEKDIILFRVKGFEVPVMHRVIHKADNLFRTKGDSNTEEDIWQITKRDIEGKLLFNIGYNIKIEDLKNTTKKINIILYSSVILLEWVVFILLAY